MSMITTDQVKELRDQTGISIMQCKKALEDAQGDMAKALILLKKKGAEVAGKKADRVFKAGAVASYIHSNGAVGAMVELRCETDFVSRNEGFLSLAYDIAMQVAAANPEFLSVEHVSHEARQQAEKAFEEEVKGKPAAMKEKILSGKVSAYFKDRVLLEQAYIKDGEKTVANLIEEAVHKFGEKIEIARFVRYGLLES